MKSYRLFLYFKQGDDLATAREKSSSWRAAFLERSTRLKNSAEIMAVLAEIFIDDRRIRVEADTHLILIETQDQVMIEKLDVLITKFPEFLSHHTWDDV